MHNTAHSVWVTATRWRHLAAKGEGELATLKGVQELCQVHYVASANIITTCQRPDKVQVAVQHGNEDANKAGANAKKEEAKQREKEREGGGYCKAVIAICLGKH